ncbi:MAG TPA: GNAT family N-acetyltransferase [Gaiellaceae bacterium]|nr:GNAT family N-acetyltransferase [Gaiellaceae bacterium]
MLIHQPGQSFPPAGGAYRIRFEPGTLDERIAAVRSWFRGQGRAEFVWWVGTSATPDDLEARLLTRGAVPWEDGLITVMVTDEPPPEVPGIEVRRVETYEEFAAGREIGFEAAGFTAEQADEMRASFREKWDDRRRSGSATAYLAYVDGEPVASGDMLFLPFAGFLSGATTKPEYRGRGVYRALVRARWEEATRRGTPALVIGAGSMSRPILERIGFRAVAEQHLLLDRSGLST